MLYRFLKNFEIIVKLPYDRINIRNMTDGKTNPSNETQTQVEPQTHNDTSILYSHISNLNTVPRISTSSSSEGRESFSRVNIGIRPPQVDGRLSFETQYRGHNTHRHGTPSQDQDTFVQYPLKIPNNVIPTPRTLISLPGPKEDETVDIPPMGIGIWSW